MAEAPKKGARKLYGKTPRIDDEPAEGDTLASSAAGAPDEAAAEAESTAGGAPPKANMMIA